jgi:hypothetical protein
MPQVKQKIPDGALLALIDRKYPMTISMEENFLFNPLQISFIFKHIFK